jgi:hypothetical protein
MKTKRGEEESEESATRGRGGERKIDEGEGLGGDEGGDDSSTNDVGWTRISSVFRRPFCSPHPRTLWSTPLFSNGSGPAELLT